MVELNFLGHIVLARDSTESRIGNFLGDFVKGLPSSFPEKFGDDLVDGILMHRAVDVFTDAHPAFLRAKSLLAPERRRFAGIIVDVFFDHFLSLEWDRLMNIGSREFISQFYSDVTSFRIPDVIDGFPEIATRMAAQDWLGSYASVEGIALTIQRVSARSARLAPMLGAEDDLKRHFREFRECFDEFFPDVKNFAERWQRERPVSRQPFPRCGQR